ncbi:hypothetical protein [Jeotgalibacillus malaysiensis]|uniref:hypothetical protein n=1 Tax=Jeotgalibacillus malaysiensis TaxID=1508404 RepID=UPI0038511597
MNYIKLAKMLSFILIVSMLSACSNGIEIEEPLDYSILTSEETFPDNFREIEVSEKDGTMPMMSAETVWSPEELTEAWERYSFKEDQPAISFSEQSVLFLTIHESGSCEEQIGAISTNHETNDIEIHFIEIDGDCSADAQPRSFAIEIDTLILEQAQNAVVVKQNRRVVIELASEGGGQTLTFATDTRRLKIEFVTII